MNYEETIKAVENIDTKPKWRYKSWLLVLKEAQRQASRFLKKHKDVVKDAYCARVYFDGGLRIIYELKEIIRVELCFVSDISICLKSYILPDGNAIGHFDLVMMKTDEPIVMLLEALLADKFDYEHTYPYFKEKQEYIRNARKNPDSYYSIH